MIIQDYSYVEGKIQKKIRIVIAYRRKFNFCTNLVKEQAFFPWFWFNIIRQIVFSQKQN